MAIRATEDLKFALIKTYTAGENLRANYPVNFDTSDGTVDEADSGDQAMGVTMEAAVSGAQVQVCRYGSNVIKKVLVGTGGATQDAWAKMTTDGATDAGALDGGTTLVEIVGRFVETGVAGDIVGMELTHFSAVT